MYRSLKSLLELIELLRPLGLLPLLLLPLLLRALLRLLSLRSMSPLLDLALFRSLFNSCSYFFLARLRDLSHDFFAFFKVFSVFFLLCASFLRMNSFTFTMSLVELHSFLSFPKRASLMDVVFSPNIGHIYLFIIFYLLK